MKKNRTDFPSHLSQQYFRAKIKYDICLIIQYRERRMLPIFHYKRFLKKSLSPHAQQGFTLIEIMVVVVILSILAAIVVPQIIKRPDEARIVKAKQDILAIENAFNLYRLDNGFYPSTDQGLMALVKKPSSSPIPNNWQPYLKQLPMDPWGKPYQYLNPGEHSDIDISTYGADGQLGGTGINAELGNWKAADNKSEE